MPPKWPKFCSLAPSVLVICSCVACHFLLRTSKHAFVSLRYAFDELLLNHFLSGFRCLYAYLLQMKKVLNMNAGKCHRRHWYSMLQKIRLKIAFMTRKTCVFAFTFAICLTNGQDECWIISYLLVRCN